MEQDLIAMRSEVAKLKSQVEVLRGNIRQSAGMADVMALEVSRKLSEVDDELGKIYKKEAIDILEGLDGKEALARARCPYTVSTVPYVNDISEKEALEGDGK